MHDLDETHDASIASWVASANDPTTDFPLQNLPFGVFRRTGESAPSRVGVAIGGEVLDLGACVEAHLLTGVDAITTRACQQPTLNALMALDAPRRAALRRVLHHALRGDVQMARARTLERHLIPASAVMMVLPAVVGDFTDFFASIHHATNVGALVRPDDPLFRNYKYLPLAYHGRVSSLCVSGTAIQRPAGQLPTSQGVPRFGLSRRLDFELEVGFLVGPGNDLGAPIDITDASQHIVGICLLNDWSARDIQAWENQPLGPFLGKSFATTISPWVVTSEALAPFRVPAAPRPADDPQPLPYLWSEVDQRAGGLNIELEVQLLTMRMRAMGEPPVTVTRTNLRTMYWTPAQMVTHHASNGCNLRPGDLFGSGTASGPDQGSEGSLLELTRGGRVPLALPNGEARTFLEDGDEVILRGGASAPGRARIGLGECRGRVVAEGGTRLQSINRL